MRWKTETEIVQDNLQQHKESVETIRNSRGLFIRGHSPLGVRDKATGRFTKASVEVKQQPTKDKDRHSAVAFEVDRFFIVGVKE